MNKSKLYNVLKWIVIGSILCVLILLSAIEVTSETHLWLSVGAILLVLLGSKSSDKKLLHLLVLITGAFISLRYIGWRYSDTLPWESSFDLPFAMLLLVTECYGITIYLLGMFVNVRQKNRQITPINTALALPTVDVFIPTYDESIRVLAPTISAAMQLEYPGQVKIWVLDDGGTAQKIQQEDGKAARAAQQRASSIQDLCLKLGANYLTRPKNEHAKAGNINHALEYTSSELILILDADHVPSNDFLLNTIGMFQQQANLGFVQTPHFFSTPGPVERNLGIDEQVAPENEMFYNRILSGMDFWNASFFCGSAAVIRRQALLEVGGISTRTITEDADTALDIHARGWDSAYLNKAMIAGLSPDTFGAYVTQRSRWGQGMVQIFLLNNPIFKKGLSWPQKLCYLNSTLFWLFPLFRVSYLIAPLCYLLFNLQIFVGNGNDFLIFAVPHLAISILINQHLFGKTRNTLFSEFYETVLSLYLFLPTLSVIINPKKPSFTVTPKGETTNQTHFSPLTPVLLVLLAIIIVAEIWGIHRIYNYPVEQGQLTVVVIFNTLNLLLCMVSLGAMLEKVQRRSEPRVPCHIPALVKFDGHELTAKICNASVHGLQLQLNSTQNLPIKDQQLNLIYYIDINHAAANGKPKYQAHATNIQFRSGHEQGEMQTINCQLVDSNEENLNSFTQIIYSRSEPWQRQRQLEEQRSKSILMSIAHFFQLAFSSASQALNNVLTTKIKTSTTVVNSTKQDTYQ
ncbi:UDP-forming cellulose synthase catalytic subunit [Moritella marina]|uniref:UDP-forming cellulose synthase catalytic subunit n=1 Tax=Moritella marina TaxID=90736 RepID=UPI003703D074